jgi:hypothetical protein
MILPENLALGLIVGAGLVISAYVMTSILFPYLILREFLGKTE